MERYLLLENSFISYVKQDRSHSSDNRTSVEKCHALLGSIKELWGKVSSRGWDVSEFTGVIISRFANSEIGAYDN